MNNPAPFPRPKRDDPILDWAVQVADAIDRRRLVEGYGIAIDDLPSGLVVNCTLPVNAPRHAKTQGSGIAAATSVTQMTSGTVDLWTSSSAGALTDTTTDVTAWNKATTAIPANTHIMIQDDASGLAVVVWVAC